MCTQEAIKRACAARVAELQGEVERMQPNMRAVEKYEDMGRRLKEVGACVFWFSCACMCVCVETVFFFIFC